MDTPLKYHPETIRELAPLTTSYVPMTIIGEDKIQTDNLYTDNQLILYLNIANLGNMTSVQLIQEFSDDGVLWAQETFASISGGTETDTLGLHQFASVGVYRLATPIKDRFVRVSVKGTGGTGTGSSVGCLAIYGTA